MADTTTEQRLLGTADLAARFGYSKSAIKLLDRMGVLPAAQRVAGRLIWREDEIELISERLKARRDGRRQESGKAA